MMKPCRIEFESYSLSGENFEYKDNNIGKVVIISADIEARHSEPISFFPTNIEKSFPIRILGPLIKRFSGIRKDNLKYIDLSKHIINLPFVEEYRERLMGKIIGCGVKKGLPYNSYSFSFSPFGFFFDPFLDGEPFSNPENKEILRILRSARQEILDTYQKILNISLFSGLEKGSPSKN